MLELLKKGASIPVIVAANGVITLERSAEYTISFKIAGNTPWALENSQLFFEILNDDKSVISLNLSKGIWGTIRNNVFFGQILFTSQDLAALTEPRYSYRLSFSDNSRNQQDLSFGQFVLDFEKEPKKQKVEGKEGKKGNNESISPLLGKPPEINSGDDANLS